MAGAGPGRTPPPYVTQTIIKNRGRPSWDFVLHPPEAGKRLSLLSAHGPYRGHQGPKTLRFRRKYFLVKPQRKIKSNVFFSIFGGVRIFLLVGARNFSKCRDPLKTSKSRISPKTRLKPPHVVRVRKLRKANAVLMSRKIPENTPVAPSYGRNDHCALAPGREA